MKNAPEQFKRQFEELCQGNRYTTTIHVINSLIVKSSKLTKVTKVLARPGPPHPSSLAG